MNNESPLNLNGRIPEISGLTAGVLMSPPGRDPSVRGVVFAAPRHSKRPPAPPLQSHENMYVVTWAARFRKGPPKKRCDMLCLSYRRLAATRSLSWCGHLVPTHRLGSTPGQTDLGLIPQTQPFRLLRSSSASCRGLKLASPTKHWSRPPCMVRGASKH